MRIISQDKTIDLPYTDMVLCCTDKSKQDSYHITAIKAAGWYMNLGSYDTMERCLEVMQDIQRKYGCGAKICELPEE